MNNILQHSEEPLPKILNILKSVQTFLCSLLHESNGFAKIEPIQYLYQIFTFAKFPIQCKAFKLMPNKHSEEWDEMKGKN